MVVDAAQILADDQDGFRLKQLDPSPLKLTNALTERAEAWQDNLKFLRSAREKLFTNEQLPENYTEREMFAPQLSSPSRPAREIYFGLFTESKPATRDQFLFIEDVYHLVFQVWQVVLLEKSLIERKYQIALRKSQVTDELTKFWEVRLTYLANLKDDLEHKIKPFVTYFEKYDYQNGSEEINHKISSDLLELRRVQSHGGDFRDALDELAEFIKRLQVEAALDVGELPDAAVEPAAAALEEIVEKPAEVIADVPASVSEAVAEEAPAEEGGDQPNQPNQPDQPNPPKIDEPLRPDRRPATPTDLHTQATNNLKVITLETERLTRIYLNSLATSYDLPPELLQNQNPMFRDMIREDVRGWIMSQLRAGKLDSIYDPTKIREHQMDMQLAIEHLKSTLQHDARFELFSDVLFEHFKQLNSDPTAQAKFKRELNEGKFIDPKVWDATFDQFSQNLLAPVDGQVAVNPSGALNSALSGPFSALASQLAELGITDFNLKDNPTIFNEKVINIVNLVDIMAFGNYPPLFLSSLGKSNFEAVFKIKLTDTEFSQLLPIMETYWTIRVGYFSRNNIDLNIIGQGLDPDDVRDWFENISQSDSETFYRNYLARLEELAQEGRSVGGFHRVILTMAPKKVKGTQEADGIDEPDTIAPEVETATKKLKLQVMQEALALTWDQLPDKVKLEVYYEIDESQADDWLRDNYFPDQITFEQLGKISKYAMMAPWEEAEREMAKAAITDEANFKAGVTAYLANGADFGNSNPPAQAANQAIQQISASRNKFRQFSAYLKHKKRVAAKKAAKKAVEAGTKATAETTLNAIGSALGIPGVGTVLVNLWYSLPKEFRPVVGFLFVTAPLALFAGVGGFIFSLLNGQAGAWLASTAGSIGGSAGSFFKNLFNGTKTGAAQAGVQTGGGYASPAAARTATTAATNSTAVAAKASTATQAAKMIKAMNPATQAVLMTVGGSGAAAILNYMVVSYAFVANFPLPEQDPSTKEKISRYLSLEKAITLPPACDQTTLKCPELAEGQSYQVTYTITLTSKGNYVVSITDVLDQIVAKFSKKKYEELGQLVPANITITKVVIPISKPGSKSDFPELSADPNDERNIIRPGEQVIITYTETYDSGFNHSQISNDFRADFYWVDGANSGTDYVETAKSICIGDCTLAEGCWPATGMDLQGPYEGCSNCTHSVVDAFDIMDPHNHASELQNLGVDMAKISNPAKIYSPFDGTACFPSYDDVYGNYVIIDNGKWNYWLAHMTSRIQESGCRDINAGEIVGIMGNTGSPGMAVHLHFELRTTGGSVSVGGDELGPQMPPSLLNNQPPDEDAASGKVDYVLSCYDED